jgi:hypothetical protein
MLGDLYKDIMGAENEKVEEKCCIVLCILEIQTMPSHQGSSRSGYLRGHELLLII